MTIDIINYKKLWLDFNEKITHESRFFCNHEVLNHLKKLIENNVIIVEDDTILYRARIYNDGVSFIDTYEKIIGIRESIITDNERENRINELNFHRYRHDLENRVNTGFYGYNEAKSSAPQNKNIIKDGRANPDKICYLYLASDEITAVAEVRPLVEDYVSIANVNPQKKLRLIDFSSECYQKANEVEEFFAYLLYREFSRPNNGNKENYLISQYITEYVKMLGYDGIKYSSSLNSTGSNFAIFKPEHCKAVSSKLYSVKDVCMELICEAPFTKETGKKDIYHWKLLPYKQSLNNHL